MADFNSSLPVRTESPGDVIVKIADATVPSQQLAIDAAGLLGSKTYDGLGVAITSTLISGKEGLDVNVINPLVTTIGVADESAFAYGVDLDQPIAGVYQDTAPSVSAGVSAAIRITANRAMHMNLRDASGAELGDSDASGLWVRLGDGTHALSITAAGEAKVDITQPLPAGSNIIGSVGVTNLPTTVDTNYGAVGASTLRSAAQLGNATGAADFNAGAIGAQTLRTAALISNASGLANFGAGATGAQTLRVEANQGAANATPWNENIAQIAGASPSASNSLPVQISTGSSFVSSSNPLPVILDPAGAGTVVCDYKDASAIAAGASDNHDYTVTAGKTLHLRQIESSASGKAKMILSVETGVASGVFTVKAAQFNSTASPDMSLVLASDILVAAGVRVRVAMSNRDVLAEDLYSSIIGFEI